jgi:ribosomal 50S subunit-recycling heat shock protein
MRLDLFLKISRLVKRRTLARELCDAGRVLVNGHEAKPGKEIKAGDTITLKYTSRTLDLKVLDMPVSPKKAPAETFYTVTSETKLPRENDLWSENPLSS